MSSGDHGRPVLAISFGGSKIALGIIAGGGWEVLARSPRIEWRTHSSFDPRCGFESLLQIIADHAESLFAASGTHLTDIGHIGVAWPGPGRYSEGWLQATFLPDLAAGRDVHRAIAEVLALRFGVSFGLLRVVSRLDVNARAAGEVRLARGGLSAAESRPAPSGLVLNVATGVAGACVRAGETYVCWRELGETYGQWGRYVFKDLATGAWSWRATEDGSIASHSPSQIRFTDYCGGPALVRRYSGQSVADICCERDIVAERECLTLITCDAYRGSDRAAAFVRQIGRDIGAAVKCVIEGLGALDIATRLILTGGVGEFFGRPSRPVHEADVLIAAVTSELTGWVSDVRRSEAGLDAELAGVA
jgi:hypothetical protein